MPIRRAGNVAALIFFAATLALSLSACSTQVEVVDAKLRADGVTLQLATASCNRNPTANVHETSDRVEILVNADRSWSRASDACSDGVVVVLSRTLGKKPVIDMTTNQELDVLVAGR